MRGTSRLVLVCAAVAAMACSVALIGPGAPPPAQAQPEQGWLPDPSWGPWQRFTDPAGANEFGESVSFQPWRTAVDDLGRIIVAGVRTDYTQGTMCDLNSQAHSRRFGDQAIVITRYQADGSVDREFGESGSVITPQTSQEVWPTDLVISGGSIYVSASTGTIDCGRLDPQNRPAFSPSVVVKVKARGAMAEDFGGGGVWTMATPDEVNIDDLGDGTVGALSEGVFVSLGDNLSTTDLREQVCAASNDGAAGRCQSGRVAAQGTKIAAALTRPGRAGAGMNGQMHVFFGEMKAGKVRPDERSGESGIVTIDFSKLLDGRGLLQSQWAAWDGQGRLLVVAPSMEMAQTLSIGSFADGTFAQYIDQPHGRGLASARFAESVDGGFELDETYGIGGLAHVSLGFQGSDNFALGAMSLDGDGQPLVAGQWWNPGAPYSAQFMARLTVNGSLDLNYGGCTAFGETGCTSWGQGGFMWLPGQTPPITGKLALDNRDNQYFASVWHSFSVRNKDSAPFQLGRLTGRGVIQIRDGGGWRPSKEQMRVVSRTKLLKPIPSVVTDGATVTIRARVVSVSTSKSGKRDSRPVRNATVRLMMYGPSTDWRQVAVTQGRTNSTGGVVLKARFQAGGIYFVSTFAGDRIVSSGTPPSIVQIRARSTSR